MPSPSAASTKTYGLPKGETRTAVDQLDLTICAGETYALLGPNGAGKSTTIEILEGHRKPDSGEIMVLGTRSWKAAPSFRARIGIMHQEATDSGELRVSEALRWLASCFPTPRPVDEVIEAVGLNGKGGVRISTLSGGTKRVHPGGPAGTPPVLHVGRVLSVLPASGLAAVRDQFLPFALDGERLEVCLPAGRL